jgi:hypothetical protein
MSESQFSGNLIKAVNTGKTHILLNFSHRGGISLLSLKGEKAQDPDEEWLASFHLFQHLVEETQAQKSQQIG